MSVYSVESLLNICEAHINSFVFFHRFLLICLKENIWSITPPFFLYFPILYVFANFCAINFLSKIRAYAFVTCQSSGARGHDLLLNIFFLFSSETAVSVLLHIYCYLFSTWIFHISYFQSPSCLLSHPFSLCVS